MDVLKTDQNYLSINSPKFTRSLYGLLTFFLILMTACQQQPKADMIVNGKIWTGDHEQPFASSMAIVSDTIAAVGSVKEIADWKGDETNEINTEKENLIVPGFIDAHTHFMDAGYRLSSVQLRDAKTPKEFIKRIAEFAKTLEPGTWILGGEWDHKNWGGELPTRAWIDSVTTNNPIWIQRLDLHMGLANTVALKLAGVTKDVEKIPGGGIIRNSSGRLTGIFKDKAKGLIVSAIPKPTKSKQDAALDKAMQYAVSQGVTSIHSLRGSSNKVYYDIFKRAHDQNRLKVRVYYSKYLKNWADLDSMIQQSGKGDKWLRIGLLKGFVDGSLGSHTAAFMEPYTDTPSDSGFFVNSKEKLYKNIKSADSLGLQVAIHGIGDRAIHSLLDIFEQVSEENGRHDRRFRIEHAQHINPEDMDRLASLNVIASMQPYHAIDDGRWAEKVIGHKRAKTTYAFRSLMDAGTKVAFGSDWPVAPISPLMGIYAAVTRRTLDEKNPEGWIPEQKITVEEALQAYTQDAAFASFEENRKGILKAGKLADFVVLDRNILEIDPVKIPNVNVLKTIVGGKEVYSAVQEK